MDNNNRRRYERFPFYESVAIQKKTDEAAEGSLSEDISQSGLKLNVNEFIPLNTVLELQIHFPGKVSLVNAQAKVVWVRESPKSIDAWQIGLEMIDQNSSLPDIENYIRLQRFKLF